MAFKWNDEHTPQVLNSVKDRECIWRATSEQYRNKTARINAIQKNCARAGVSETQRKESKMKKKSCWVI
jgi:hypothetical protein